MTGQLLRFKLSLPSIDIVNVHTELCGTPTSHGSAWARVQEYTFLVREITLNLFVPAGPYQDDFDISLDLLEFGFRDTFWYQLSSAFGATQILPRLEVATLRSCGLGARCSDLVFGMGMLCFLGPTVRAFNVDAPQMDPERHLEFVHAFAVCFSSVQHLEAISLDTLVPVLDIGALPQLHPCLRHLELKAYVESNDLLLLASLQCLEDLSVRVWIWEPPTLPIKFTGLRALTVSGDEFSAVSALIADVDAPQLRSLSISETHEDHKELCRELSSSLGTLVVKWPSLITFHWMSDQWLGNSSGSGTLAELLTPLLSVRTIRNFSTSFRGPTISYNPVDIRALAEAWPDLETLELPVNDSDIVNQYADLGALLTFAHCCPRLRTLRIPRLEFNPDAPSAPVCPPGPHWLNSLDVATLVLCGEQDVAIQGELFRGLIQRVFPAANLNLNVDGNGRNRGDVW
ncbi:hypothetical protein V8D89_011526 [Ganoderma adspersum]